MMVDAKTLERTEADHEARVAALREQIATCVDLIAMQLGIDLGAAVVSKFNATSEKVGLATRIGE